MTVTSTLQDREKEYANQSSVKSRAEYPSSSHSNWYESTLSEEEVMETYNIMVKGEDFDKSVSLQSYTYSVLEFPDSVQYTIGALNLRHENNNYFSR